MDAWKALRAVKDFDSKLSSKYVITRIVLRTDPQNTRYCAEMSYEHMRKQWFTLKIDNNSEIVVEKGGSMRDTFPVQTLDLEWRCEKLRENTIYQKGDYKVVKSIWEQFATDTNTGEEHMIYLSEVIIHLY